MDAKNITAGRLDPSFGDGGKVILKAQSAITHADDMATGDDDSIFVALSVFKSNDISVGSLFGLAKLHPDGRTDNTFGIGGYAVHAGPGGTIGVGTIEYGINAKGMQPFILPDGKILLRCTAGPAKAFAPQVPFVALFNPDGSLDASFGKNGIRYFEFEDHVLLAATLIPLTDGKMVVAGRRARHDGKVDGVIMRLLEDGQADPSFGEEGILAVEFPGGSQENVQCAVIQGDKFVLAGMNRLQALVRRYLTGGEIDRTFGTEGTYRLPEEEDPDAGGPWFEHLLLTGKGSLIGVGIDGVPGGDGTFSRFGFVVGIDADGRPNQEFAGGKPVYTPEDLGPSQLAKGMFDPSDRLVVAGSLGAPSSEGFLVGRYSSSGFPDETFGDRGFQFILLGEPFEIARGFTLQGSKGILLSGQVVNEASDWKSNAVVMRVLAA
jgi:uncharacterized delta-60 repeat protein